MLKAAAEKGWLNEKDVVSSEEEELTQRAKMHQDDGVGTARRECID